MFDAMLDLLKSSAASLTDSSQEESLDDSSQYEEDVKPDIKPTRHGPTKIEKTSPYQSIYVPSQVHDFFEIVFEQSPILAPAQTNLLCRYFSLSKKTVLNWFRNRRRHVVRKEQEKIRGRELRSLRPVHQHKKNSVSSTSDSSALSQSEDVPCHPQGQKAFSEQQMKHSNHSKSRDVFDSHDGDSFRRTLSSLQKEQGYSNLHTDYASCRYRDGAPFSRSYGDPHSLMQEWTNDSVSCQDQVVEVQNATPSFNCQYTDMTSPSNMESQSDYTNVHNEHDRNLNWCGEDLAYENGQFYQGQPYNVITNTTDDFGYLPGYKLKEAENPSEYCMYYGQPDRPTIVFGEKSVSPGTFDIEDRNYVSEGGYNERDQQDWGVPRPRYDEYMRVVLSPTWDPIARILSRTNQEVDDVNRGEQLIHSAQDYYSNTEMHDGLENGIAFEKGEIYLPDAIDPATGTSQVFFSPPSHNVNQQQSTNTNESGRRAFGHSEATISESAIPIVYFEDARGQVSSLNEFLEMEPVATNKTYRQPFSTHGQVPKQSEEIDWHGCHNRVQFAPAQTVETERTMNPFHNAGRSCGQRFEESPPTYGGNLFDDLSAFTTGEREDVEYGNTDGGDYEGADGGDYEGSVASQEDTSSDVFYSDDDEEAGLND